MHEGMCSVVWGLSYQSSTGRTALRTHCSLRILVSISLEILRILLTLALSHQLGDLSAVPCNVKVAKKLIQCEHKGEMKCSDDPATFLCTKQCSGIMKCCGRTCNSTCNRCARLNAQSNGAPASVERVLHEDHPCQKPLFCGHNCGKACSEDHECRTMCKAACRQVCMHTVCKNYCSAPCSPCQQACTW